MNPRHLLSLLTLVLGTALALTVLGATPATASYDRDCGDFANQRDAQIFFLNAGGPSSDPHRLDSEGDGLACESLPCPCYYSTSKPQSEKPAPAPPKAKPKKKATKSWGRITKVVDGDTVYVRLNKGGKVKVRLLAVNSPEVHGRVECGGRPASRFMKRHLPHGTKVLLTSDPTQSNKDSYGRVLRYVTRTRDGRDMNRALVRNGHATANVYFGKPAKRYSGYRTAQRQARASGLGMWGHC